MSTQIAPPLTTQLRGSFSNAPGNYGTNVNFMVMQSEWGNDSTLGDLFVTRKCFAYTRDSKGRTVEGREARHLMDDALSRVEATYQNIDSFEVGITDVDHYFEYSWIQRRLRLVRNHARRFLFRLTLFSNPNPYPRRTVRL